MTPAGQRWTREVLEPTDEQLRALNKRVVELPSYETILEENRVLRGALEQIAMSNEGWTREQLLDCARVVLTPAAPLLTPNEATE